MAFNSTLVLVILIGAGLFQGLMLLGFLLSRPSRQSASTIYLILLILTVWFQMAFKAISKMDLIAYANFWYCVGFELPFLYGPLLYGYTFHSLTENSKFRWVELFHIHPFAFFFSVLTIFSWTQAEWCTWFFFPSSVWHGLIHIMLQLTSILSYALLSWKLSKAGSSVFSPNVTAWHRQLIIILSIAVITIIISLKFLYYQFPSYDQWRPAFVVLVILAYWISYKILTESRSEETPKASWLSITKYRKTVITKADSDRILSDLAALLETEKPFLDAELTIDQLALKLKTQKHLLSRVINECLKKNFYDLMQSYRVQHAVTLLTDPTKNHFTIAAIGFESGFKSLSSFNATFKKLTGKTPSFYRLSDRIPA